MYCMALEVLYSWAPGKNFGKVKSTRMKEEQVGIECRLGGTEELFKCGDIKTHVEDFQVNEVDPDGTVCTADAPFYHPSYTPPVAVKDEPVLVPTLDELAAVLAVGQDGDTAKRVLELHGANGSTEQIICGAMSKEQRTQVHVFFKKHFGGKLVTDTTADGFLRISRRGQNYTPAPEAGVKRRRYDPRNDRTVDTFPYVQAWLVKTGVDTMEVMHELARILKINVKDISFAGTKDRRAVTVQRIAFRNLAVSKLRGVKSDKFRLCGIRPATSQLNLGDLTGNRFTLIIRNIEPEVTQERVSALVEAFARDGFVNYYGLQRFGTQAIGTHEIGLKMIMGDLLGAADLLLAPNLQCDNPVVLKAKRKWLAQHDERSAEELASLLPRAQNSERQLCNALGKNAKDLQGAWMAVKREARMMYVHAVQSYLFNRCVSQYLQSHIDKYDAEMLMPIVGSDNTAAMLKENPHLGDLMKELGLEEIKSVCPGLWDLSGDERKMIVRPGDVEFEVIDSTTLKLSFSLPKSAYATMALRQLFLNINSK